MLLTYACMNFLTIQQREVHKNKFSLTYQSPATFSLLQGNVALLHIIVLLAVPHFTSLDSKLKVEPNVDSLVVIL